jgi:hypothetical protein
MTEGVVGRQAVHLVFAVALVLATISVMAIATNPSRATAAAASTPIYVANGFSNTITSFAEPTPGPAPSATIGDPSLLGQQNAEAFDASGDLWVASDDLLGEFGTHTGTAVVERRDRAPRRTLEVRGPGRDRVRFGGRSVGDRLLRQ